MLTAEQIRDKILELPFSFENHYRNALRLPGENPKRIQYFTMAEYVYCEAVTLSVFVELPQSDMIRLFGNRAYKEDYEELEDGLFREAAVNKVCWECLQARKAEDAEKEKIQRMRKKLAGG